MLSPCALVCQGQLGKDECEDRVSVSDCGALTSSSHLRIWFVVLFLHYEAHIGLKLMAFLLPRILGFWPIATMFDLV